MKIELSIRIAGEAGQGMQTIGSVMSSIFKLAGLHVFANQDYMSRVRGGNNFFQIRVADSPVYAIREQCDILVVLDKASVALHKGAVRENGVIIADRGSGPQEDGDPRIVDIPMHAQLEKIGAPEIYVNSVACGVLAGITGVPFGFAEETLRLLFKKKGEAVVATNLMAAAAGNELAHALNLKNRFSLPVLPELGHILISGNEALGLGAVRAGVKFYTAYPMTPSTGIMDALCRHAPAHEIVVEQAEDEIAAVNMVIGASYAGVRAMTSTSGGGFALMGEGVSLAAMIETPLVMVNGQRPAPATGFPTRTEQADLDLVIHSGHGEFARAVFAPGTIEEAFDIMQHAFNLAEKYQIPVIVLSDQHLADTTCTVNPMSLKGGNPERFILSKEESERTREYRRYAITGSGISPRAVPSWIEGPVYADSDEHTEEGHITEDAGIRVAMVDKRFRKKLAGLEKEIICPTAFNLHNADMVLVGFGSTYGVMREVAETATEPKIGFLHLSQVWPFPVREVAGLLADAKQIVTVENNAGAQLAKLMRRETGIKVHRSILKYDGRPFDVDHFARELRNG